MWKFKLFMQNTKCALNNNYVKIIGDKRSL